MLSGWGNGSWSSSHVEQVSGHVELERLMRRAVAAKRPVLARGLGRSYGDAAQCAGGFVVDCTSLDHVIHADFERGIVRVGAGMSIARLLEIIVPEGWFVPVTPGTSYITIGGAIAFDVHGKNHHQDGSFSAFVLKATLVTATGPIEISADENPDVFWATVAGMGLTGVLTEVTLRLSRIESALISVDTDRTKDLDECMGLLVGGDSSYHYSVAWVDCTATGAHLGRSVLTRGDHARRADLPEKRAHHAMVGPHGTRLRIPFALPTNLVIPPVIRLFNEAYFRRAPAHRTDELQTFGSFFYPLDIAGDWNRLYGPRGFTQYQFVVPFAAHDAVRSAIELLQAANVSPALAVLKRFGAADPAPMSFPMPGWTLAMDIALSKAALGPLLDQLDELVATAGGRVYLAKDGRLKPELVALMYPRLESWRQVRGEVDRDGIFRSDLARRLGLVG
jgi:decaprenylphospho-beta-D-ribofuranose 2-oxidase